MLAIIYDDQEYARWALDQPPEVPPGSGSKDLRIAGQALGWVVSFRSQLPEYWRQRAATPSIDVQAAWVDVDDSRARLAELRREGLREDATICRLPRREARRVVIDRACVENPLARGCM